MTNITNSLRTMNTILNIAIVLIALSLVFILKDQQFSQWLIPLLIFFQILAIILDYFYQKRVDKAIFENRKNELLKEADPDKHKNTIQGAREELRLGLEILMSASVVICLIWAISAHNILIPAGCLCLLCVAYLYADYIPHTYSYAKKYDIFSMNDWIAASYIQGLARIYLEEYTRTRFCRSHSLYSELPWDLYRNTDKDAVRGRLGRDRP